MNVDIIHKGMQGYHLETRTKRFVRLLWGFLSSINVGSDSMLQFAVGSVITPRHNKKYAKCLPDHSLRSLRKNSTSTA